LRRPFEPPCPLRVLILAGVAWLSLSCRSHDLGLLPQTRLKPDVISSVSFDPSRLKRVGVLPFMEEGMQWEESLPGQRPEPSEADVAGRFSENIARRSELEVVTPEKITSFFTPDMLEVSTRKQVTGLCKKMGLDGLFRGQAQMSIERASSVDGEVDIPFAFFTLEVELLEAEGGETVWFAKQHINSFQFLDDPLGISTGNWEAAQMELADKIPGYPDPDRTLTVLGELAIAEVADSFRRSFDAGVGQ